MPEPVSVSLHALNRYRQRVENVSQQTAFARLTSSAFEAAALFGDCSVILPTGHKAVVKNATVVTVLPKHPEIEQ